MLLAAKFNDDMKRDKIKELIEVRKSVSSDFQTPGSELKKHGFFSTHFEVLSGMKYSNIECISQT